MSTLAIDTSTTATAVALEASDGSIREARDDPPAGSHPGHATRLLGLADGLLAEAGGGWAQVRRIAVGVGPGGFTGLRVGLATAHGLASSIPAQLVGVSSTMALAAGALDGGRAGTVLAVIDARRGEVFAGLYTATAGAPAELTAPSPVAPGALQALVDAAPRTQPVLVVGDGAVRHRAALEWAAELMPDEDSPLHLVTAAAICVLARAMPAGSSDVLPDYRRRPDAELALAAPPGARP